MKVSMITAICLMLLVPSLSGAQIQWPVDESGNGHWYQFFPDNADMTWEEARALAESTFLNGEPGHLATLNSQAENDWILVSFQTAFTDQRGHLHIGGFLSDTGWCWVTGEPWIFQNWDNDEPNGAHCRGLPPDVLEVVVRDGRLVWNDTSNDCGSFGFIVEWDFAPVPVLPSTWGSVKRKYEGEK